MSDIAPAWRRRAIILIVVGVVLLVSMFTRPAPDYETPWEFSRDALPHVDSIGKVLALVFFTTVLAFMNFMGVTARLRLHPLIPAIALVVPAALAAFSPAVRRARLVHAGFVLVGLGVVPLAIAGIFNNNPLGFGFLFAFLTPIGGLLLIVGTIAALTRTTTSPTT